MALAKTPSPWPGSPQKKIVDPATKTLEMPVEELRTGTVFAGRYQIIEKLGEGGMGKVYKVLDLEIDTKIALKLIHPLIATDQRTIERFRNELKIARGISHKNINRMYALNKEGENYFITMEYVAGEDLERMIKMTRGLSVGSAAGYLFLGSCPFRDAHREAPV
jgi:serine/threonine protein kinase